MSQLGQELTWDRVISRANLPCANNDADLWFAEAPERLELAKALCTDCQIRGACLRDAISRKEPWGVWGGEILHNGRIIARKRRRGRPRKEDLGLAA